MSDLEKNATDLAAKAAKWRTLFRHSTTPAGGSNEPVEMQDFIANKTPHDEGEIITTAGL